MAIYTVIGLHENGEVFAEQETASDPHAAIAAVAKRKSYADAEILGAIETTAPMTCACEDAGKSAHVCDLDQTLRCGDCDEEVEKSDRFAATPCGTFCDDCMTKHAQTCGVCADEFGIATEDDANLEGK
jgi:hypothetical protein